MSLDLELDPVKLSKLYMIKIRKLRFMLGSSPHLETYIRNKLEPNISEEIKQSKKLVLDYIHDFFGDIIEQINYEIDKKYCVELDTTYELYYLDNNL